MGNIKIVRKLIFMEEASRLKKSVLNAQVNFFFFLTLLLLSFFSRRMFLNCLGDDFVGLTSTIGSLMGFLNLAELGVGTAMAYVLYAPLFRHDVQRINELISVLGFLYRRIGQFILVAGLVLACFLSLIFKKTDFSDGVIYFAYFVFLGSTLIGYFANYHTILLNADQRGYMITAYFQSANIIKVLAQMGLAWYTGNYYYWLALELVFGVTYAMLLRWKIYRIYPWLKSDVRLGRKVLKKYPEITTYIKQIFAHQIGGFVLGKTDDLVIYAFVSLQMVAYYGNYVLFTSKISQLINSILGSVVSGVGNLIAEGNLDSIKRVFWELMAIRYLLAGTGVFALYYLLEPFISLWLGEEYILSRGVLALLLINLFIMQTRWAVDIFINGYGLFHDIWAPCTEAILNLGISIIFARLWGIQGVLLGTTVSILLIVCLWKPYFLYRNGFKTSLWEYWLTIFKYLGLGILSWGICSWLLELLGSYGHIDGYGKWMIVALETTGSYLVCYFILLYLCSLGMRGFVYRIGKSLYCFIQGKFLRK